MKNSAFSARFLTCGTFCVAVLIALSAVSELRAQAVVISGEVYLNDAMINVNNMDTRINPGAEFSGDGTWKFSGNTESVFQNFAGADAAFHHVMLRNSQGMRLEEGDLFVNGNFDFSFGVLRTHAHRLVFGPESSASGARNLSYAEGNVAKEGGKDFVFPVGESGMYLPVEIFDLSDEHSVYEASYHAEAHPDPEGPWYDGNNWPVSTCDYWSLYRTSGGGEAAVRLGWGSNPCTEVNDPQYMRVARYAAGEWELLASEPDNSTGETVGTTGETGMFGDFALASIGSGINVLPITLIEFTAEASDAYAVRTAWSTASEVNNDYFTVERSVDAQTWTGVGTTGGAGNSNTRKNYSFTDRAPLSGKAYYRLRQTDFDGTTTVSDPVAVVMPETAAPDFVLKNVRSEDGRIRFDFTPAEGMLRVEVFDLLGKRAAAATTEGSAGSSALSHQLPRGVYILRISRGSLSSAVKFFL